MVKEIGMFVAMLFGVFSVTCAPILLIFSLFWRKKYRLVWPDVAIAYSSPLLWWAVIFVRPQKTMVNVVFELLILGVLSSGAVIVSHLYAAQPPVGRRRFLFAITWAMTVLLQLMFPFMPLK